MPRELKAAIRNEKGRHAAQRLRNNNQIPAVIYREGKVGTNLAIPRNEWLKVLTSGERVITLKLDGGDRQALIKDVQYDSVGDETLHVDFNELREGQKVRVAVGIVIKGVPKGAVKGGVLTQAVHTIHVECLPTAIPDKITIDVEPLDLDDVLHVKEVKLPEGVVATDSPEQVIVSVHEPKVEVAAPAEGAPTEPEVLTAKKEEAPAEGAAAAGGAKPAEKKEEKKEAKK
ncbi:MAG TPA: 50S ribosomal protein L25 [Planctomycetota bacterium]|nr:50S ribosomal protein L25 [Planctomycetota bacterium]